jgi:hypothetical protein
MDKEAIEKALTDYIAYWTGMPKPEDFLTWDDLGKSIDSELSKLQTLLNGITDDQLKALATFLDKGDPGNPNASPPIPPTPPQPYIIKMIALSLIAGPIWIAQRLNYLYPTAATNAQYMNWLFTEFNKFNNFAKSWAIAKGLVGDNSVVSMLDLWSHGSDADILKQYPDSKHTHSINTLWNNMKLTTMLDDNSSLNTIPDPAPADIDRQTNAIIAVEAY